LPQVGGVAELGELILVAVPLRIEGSEKEELVLKAGNRPSNLSVQIIIALVKDLTLKVEPFVDAAVLEIVNLLAFRFERGRREVAADNAMQLVAAGFGDDLYDAAGGLAVLRFESAGLYLHLFHEA